jgi:hypothetical protein
MDDGRWASAAARELWTLFEPVHAVTYFAPEAREAFEGAGLRGFWRGYFAGRAAPLGPVGAGPVTALFFGFAPSMVARAVPDVWRRAAPANVLAARQAGAVAALRRVFSDASPDARTVSLGRAAADGLDHGGRALAAANADQPWPEEPVAALWHACTVLREHRGDGHVGALLTAGVTGCDALAWRAALDGSRDVLQPARGWTDEEWAEAERRLVARGWLDDAGAPTPAGRDAHAVVEETTDVLAAGPWRTLGPDRTEELAARLGPLAKRAWGVLRHPNPIGLPAPAEAAAP